MATGTDMVNKWLKEFHWPQTRDTGGDLFMTCKDCLKAGKENAFTTGRQIIGTHKICKGPLFDQI